METANQSNSEFNIFTNVTKEVCMYSFIALILIIIFILTPLSKIVVMAAFIKIIIVGILSYTIYLNYLQTNSLRNANMKNKNEQIVSQMNMNIMCSYVFTFFLALLTIFVIKSFF